MSDIVNDDQPNGYVVFGYLNSKECGPKYSFQADVDLFLKVTNPKKQLFPNDDTISFEQAKQFGDAKGQKFIAFSSRDWLKFNESGLAENARVDDKIEYHFFLSINNDAMLFNSNRNNFEDEPEFLFTVKSSYTLENTTEFETVALGNKTGTLYHDTD